MDPIVKGLKEVLTAETLETEDMYLIAAGMEITLDMPQAQLTGCQARHCMKPRAQGLSWLAGTGAVSSAPLG